ncbi:hypothetical protein Ddye_007184 [Dipteronia dyeriana]|uniref:Uncharacterized protein n=1 Tax=Dipteronia dyeriana TaxID=168575 RepID=A0AAD9XK08_9ROSI|nr:hypothetical protein Ddye_007184 [Dipteronia dyeriana]
MLESCSPTKILSVTRLLNMPPPPSIKLDSAATSFNPAYTVKFKNRAYTVNFFMLHQIHSMVHFQGHSKALARLITGFFVENLYKLESLNNFTFSYNYFNGKDRAYESQNRKGIVLDDADNGFLDRPKQKSPKECHIVVSKPIEPCSVNSSDYHINWKCN